MVVNLVDRLQASPWSDNECVLTGGDDASSNNKRWGKAIRPVVVVKLLICNLNFDLHLVVQVFYIHIIWH